MHWEIFSYRTAKCDSKSFSHLFHPWWVYFQKEILHKFSGASILESTSAFENMLFQVWLWNDLLDILKIHFRAFFHLSKLLDPSSSCDQKEDSQATEIFPALFPLICWQDLFFPFAGFIEGTFIQIIEVFELHHNNFPVFQISRDVAKLYKTCQQSLISIVILIE